MRDKVLFVCIHNSARSQMAAALLKKYCDNTFHVESAGLEPGLLNPLAVKAMHHIGIDISNNTTQSVFDLYKQGAIFHYVISVCEKEAAEKCPIFPMIKQHIHWSFPDPSKVLGTDDEKLIQVSAIRDQIDETIKRWCEEICAVTV